MGGQREGQTDGRTKEVRRVGEGRKEEGREGISGSEIFFVCFKKWQETE